MKKILLLIITILFLAAPEQIQAQRKRSSQPKKEITQKQVKDRQKKNRQEIKQTQKQLQANRQQIEKQLNDLNLISAEMSKLNTDIAGTQRNISLLDSRIKLLSDSIAELDSRISASSAKYGEVARKMSSRNRNATSDIAFIFSARTVAQAYRRSRAVKRFSQYRQRKSEELQSLKQQLSLKVAGLDTLKQQRAADLVSLQDAHNDLEQRRQRSNTLVAALKKEGKGLQDVMKRKQQEAQALENELSRLIALEQERLEKERKEKERLENERKEKERIEKERQAKALAEKHKKEQNGSIAPKPAAPGKETAKPTATQQPEKKPVPAPGKEKTSSPIPDTGDFADLKGYLPAPVRGAFAVVKPFGRHKHPELKYVETDNPGIDIETLPNATAVAVADGYVSDIFRLPGYHNIVMIRHGSYLTVYANIGTLSVTKGAKLKRGQAIGTVYSNPDEGGRSILHFEIRNEKAKENPEIWLAAR